MVFKAWRNNDIEFHFGEAADLEGMK